MSIFQSSADLGVTAAVTLTAPKSLSVDENLAAHPGRKVGAPVGNTNRLSHGMRARQDGLLLGKLGRRFAHVRSTTDKLRRALCDAVLATGRPLGTYELAVVQTCCRWERAALMAQKWLRDEGDKLPIEQQAQFIEMAAKASAKRDESLRLLGLDKAGRPKHVIDSLYNGPLPIDVAVADQPTQAATPSQPGAAQAPKPTGA